MTMTLSIGTVLGMLGAAFTLASFLMKTMLPLRVLALASNVLFLAYGYLESLLPGLIVNAVLLPINAHRIWEITRLSKAIARATHDTPVAEWLLPHMRLRPFRAGEVLFRRGDTADRLVYVARGELRVVEVAEPVRAGELVGEIGLFSPEKKRTQTVVCATDGELYEMTDEMIFQLYYQNPQLGFYFMRLVTGRLLKDVQRATGAPGAV
jgi:CRP/FNR family cyclic AMP-dependent transcriptional regulator